MSRQKLAICDNDPVYCHRLYEYLHGNLTLGFDIISFTKVPLLLDFVKETEVSLLIISEKMYLELKDCSGVSGIKGVLVLDETAAGGDFEKPEFLSEVRIEHLSKYQEASKVIDGILDFCVKSPEYFAGVSANLEVRDCHIYGFYSPISSCGQTSLALAVAKKLAERSKVIFLSFESFSSLPDILGISPREDITDVMYYAECERSKFSVYLEKAKETANGVDIILPARTAEQIKEIGFEKIRELTEVLIKECGYEYVILDLTEYPEGFLDTLMLCEKIITVVRTNKSDAYKQKLYDETLVESGYGAVKAKTVICQLPEATDKKALERYAKEVLESEAV